MLLGISKREAIARVGHDDGTTTREMIEVLAAGGLRVGGRLRPVATLEAIAAPRALLLGKWKKYPHWMVWSRGRVFDPVEGVYDARRGGLPRTLTVTHHLPVDDG